MTRVALIVCSLLAVLAVGCDNSVFYRSSEETLSASKYLYELDVINLYEGGYSIHISNSSPPDIGATYRLDEFDALIEVKNGHDVVFRKRITEPIGPYWGTRDSGLEMWRYEAPRDLPLQARLQLSVRFSPNSIDQLVAKHFDRLFVSKMSDE